MLLKAEEILKKVSQSNIKVQEIKQEVSQTRINEKEYKKFNKMYTGINFENYKIEQLKHICEIGNGLLNEYFILNEQDKDVIEKNIIIKLQHIVNIITYTIMNKQNSEALIQNKSLNKKLTKNIEEAKAIRKELDERNQEIKDIKNDMKSITTTIISIMLAVSIIPTAIIGMERISPEYILPFISTVILFGMVMITFVYSIYQDKIKLSTWLILILVLIATVIFWKNSINPIVELNNNLKVNEEEFVESNNEELVG